MGKQAATNVQAGAAGTGTIGEVEATPHAPKLELVDSPKRDKILVGMLEVVGAEGYDATSVRMVLDRTGLYRQAFYDNFPDKETCYLAAFEAGVARVEALAIAAAVSEDSWRGKLRAGLGAVLDFLDSEPDVGRALVVEVHAAGPEALARRADAMKKIGDFIDLARHDSEGEESPPRIAPEGIVAGIHAVVHGRLSTGATEGFRQLLPEFMYFAVLPFFGAAAASAEMQAART
ncbi:MAG TPA: TetR/AcrR family transcriptional regulator [Solirubrobacterales bacterium]|nr:TetR/AcrR family transcriptional regulator [Solirubrobacterales bacterium]